MMRYLIFGGSEFWQVNKIELYSLWLTRLLLVVYLVAMLYVILFKLNKRSRWKAIPKSIRVFTISWIIYWGGFVVYVFVTQNSHNDEWFRTFYGMGYFGTLWGLSWCLVCLSRDPIDEIPKDEIHKAYREAVMEGVEEQLWKGDDR